MTYIEQLKNPFWLSKRLEIMQRDNNICQRCGFSKATRCGTIHSNELFVEPQNLKYLDCELINNSLVSFSDDNGDLIYCKTNLTKDILFDDYIPKRLLMALANKSFIESPIYGNILGDRVESLLSKEGINKCLKLSASELLNSKGIDLIVDPEGFWIIKADMINYIKKLHILHVHHKCYRDGIEIWAQPDNEYITLCNLCHKIVHEIIMIPYYNEDGEIYQFMEVCKQCKGVGYLSQFWKIDGGVCYRCDGSGREPGSGIVK